MLMAWIRPSLLLGHNTLAGRRGRTTLLIAAIMLAASLVVAVATCVASIQQALLDRLHTTLGAADARVVHLFNGRFDARVLDQVRSWPEVERAVGRFTASITLTRPDGATDPETSLPRRITPQANGVTIPDEYEIRPIELQTGRYPEAADEILVDSFVAERLRVAIDDQVELLRFGEPMIFRVTGIYGRPILGALQRPSVQLPLATLEEAAERSGFLSDIAIVLRNGYDLDTFCESHLSGLPDQLSLEPAEMARTGFDKRIRAYRIMFSLASLFVFIACSFIVVIGMTTGVTERQRELAIARCIGATRAHTFLAQLTVGLFVGSIGAMLGVPLGIGLSWALVSYFHELVPTGLAIGWQGVALSAAGSMLAGLGGALWPALAASRVTPLQAVAVRARSNAMKWVGVMTVVALSLISIQLILFQTADADDKFWRYLLLGLPAMEVGYFLLGAPVFVLLTVTLARPMSRVLRLPGDLLRQSALSIPIRLGLTAGALQIGLAILISTWTSTQGLMADWLGRMTFADGFVFNRSGLQREARTNIENLDFIEDSCPIAYLPLQLQSGQVFGIEGIGPTNVICIGFNPEEFFRVNRVQWVQGTPEQAIPLLQTGRGILVAQEFLTARALSVGDELTLGAGRVSDTYTIVGVVSSAGLDVATQLFGIRNVYNENALNCVFADLSTIMDRYDNPDVYVMQVNLAGDISDEDALQRITAVAPGSWFVSGRRIKNAINEIGAAFLAVQTAVAFAALLLACIAMGNVLVANVASRRFEYGILRAVGAERGHLARLVVGETLLLAFTAIVVGSVFGMHGGTNDTILHRKLAGVLTQARFPYDAAVIAGAVLILMTLLSAMPAIRGLTRAVPRELLAAGRGGV